MATNRRSTPDACTYCGARVGDERAYRRHLHETHEPGELGPIDRRRLEQFRSEPGVAAETVGEIGAVLRELRYPVPAEAMVQYALWGVLASLFVAAALGVGL
ncbi:MAG: hypothetical protein ABEJ31_14955 [Haloarculaceae archaeon]